MSVFFITNIRQLGYVFTCLSVCSDYSKTTDQIFMGFYGTVGYNPESVDWILSDLDQRGQKVDIVFLRIVATKIKSSFIQFSK